MTLSFQIERECKEYNESIILGSVFWRDNAANTEDPIHAIDNATTQEEVESILKDITGFYTIITPVQSGWVICIDCIDSIPVYYTNQGGDILISDSQKVIEDAIKDLEFDEISISEYKSATYVTGPNTIYKSFMQSEPGTYIHVTENSDITVNRWFEFEYGESNHRTTNDVYEITKRVVKRLINHADGRKIVIPLTGGYDSRLLISVLIDVGYENILTISYGLPGNSDTKISKQLADSFDLDWEYCEYTHEKWYQWYRTESRKSLDEHLWRATVPALREWAALRELLDRGSIDSDCIIVPGHAGMVMGGRIPNTMSRFESLSARDLENKIMSDYYKYNGKGRENTTEIRSRIQDVIQFEGGDVKDTLAAYERFEYRERVAKQITGQVWATDYLGLNWWMPMLDLDFVEFWKNTKIEQRLGKNFFQDAVIEIYKQVDDNPIEKTNYTPTSIVEHVKDIGRNSKYKPLLERLYVWYMNRKGIDWVYEGDPTGRFGIMSYEHFKKVYNGDRHLRAYRARALLDEINIE